MNLEVLRAGGVDVDAALARMMGSEALLGRLLGKFTADQSCARFEEAAAADDSEAGLDAAHALKGVSGNLSMTRVFELTSRICELIRAGEWPAARALAADLREACDQVTAAIAACGL